MKMTEETTDYTKEQIQTIILFLQNDFVWYDKEIHRFTKEVDEANSIIISSYLKERIKDCQEEI